MDACVSEHCPRMQSPLCSALPPLSSAVGTGVDDKRENEVQHSAQRTGEPHSTHSRASKPLREPFTAMARKNRPPPLELTTIIRITAR